MVRVTKVHQISQFPHLTACKHEVWCFPPGSWESNPLHRPISNLILCLIQTFHKNPIETYPAFAHSVIAAHFLWQTEHILVFHYYFYHQDVADESVASVGNQVSILHCVLQCWEPQITKLKNNIARHMLLRTSPALQCCQNPQRFEADRRIGICRTPEPQGFSSLNTSSHPDESYDTRRLCFQSRRISNFP